MSHILGQVLSKSGAWELELRRLADRVQQDAVAARKSTVIDLANVEAADTLGRQLLAALLVCAKDTAPELVAATDARDRLWTLFEQTWEENV